MGADWRSYCRTNDFEMEGDSVLVSLPGSRVHRVSIHDEHGAYRMTSVVARAAVVAAMEALPLEV